MKYAAVSLVSIFVAVIAHTEGFNPSASLRGIVRNEENKLASNIMNDVRRMQIKNPLSSMLLRGQPMFNMPKSDRGLKLQNPFNWTSCGSANPIMEIKSLLVKPSPLSLPGDITFAFDLVFHEDISETDNVTASIKLEIMTGSTWIKIPCFGSVGSCTYQNICHQIAGLSCPSDITRQGVKCNCPFTKGEYKLKPYTVEVDAEVFIAGNYRATANLTSSTKGPLGCYKLAFSVV